MMTFYTIYMYWMGGKRVTWYKLLTTLLLRIESFRITKCRESRKIWNQSTLAKLLMDMEGSFVHHACFHSRKEHQHLENLKIPTCHRQCPLQFKCVVWSSMRERIPIQNSGNGNSLQIFGMYLCISSKYIQVKQSNSILLSFTCSRIYSSLLQIDTGKMYKKSLHYLHPSASKCVESTFIESWKIRRGIGRTWSTSGYLRRFQWLYQK